MSETNRNVRKPGLEHFIKCIRDLPNFSPADMFSELAERGYRGQDVARRSLCLMAYRHIRRVKRIHIDGEERDTLPPKSNYLLVGPTGSGKTFLIEQLFGEILNLPTALVDVTTYSETGYVGQDPSTVLTRLLHAADENPMLASIGIVCLDEFDKIASGQNNTVFAGAGTSKDVTGMGVQRELLKMLESSEIVVPLELTHSTYGDHVMMSTSDISFVAAGAFSGFHEVAKHRRDDIGFGRNEEAGLVPSRGGAFDLEIEDVENIGNFQAYGFLPELIARFSRVLPFRPLDQETLKDILRIDVVARMAKEFEHEGFELVVDEAVLDHIASEALGRETGARGLSSTLIRHLEEVAFDAFGTKSSGVVNVGMLDGDIGVTLQN